MRTQPKRGYDDCVMSLLQQDPSGLDDSARGEELTKGTSHIVLATVIAAVAVTVAVAIYILAEQKPPAATGEVTRVVAHMMHRETTGLDASGAPMPKEEFDQVLLFSHVKLHNQSKDPLFLHQVMANVTLDDGIHSSYAATPVDYERLFKAYPELAALHGASIPVETTIESGQTLEGDFVTAFRMTKQQFEARKGMDYTVAFRYRPELKIDSPTVTEQ